MCHQLDKRFFDSLSRMDPAQVSRRTGCAYDAAERCFAVPAWGEEYRVFPESAAIRPVGADSPPPSNELGLVIVFYLLQAKDAPLAGEWVSERDLPSGALFFRGPHALPAPMIADRFGEDLAAFKTACEKLGGAPQPMADAAYSFLILPRVPVAVLLWRGDDEFPPEAKLLFDRTIALHLPLDVIFALAQEVCSRLCA